LISAAIASLEIDIDRFKALAIITIARSGPIDTSPADVRERFDKRRSSMIRSNTATAALLMCAAIGFAAQAHAGPPGHPPSRVRTRHSSQPASQTLAPARSLAAFSEPLYTDLGAPDGSAAIAAGRRWRGLTWSLLQAPRQDWTEGQPITLFVGIGPSAQRYPRFHGAPPLSAAGPQTMAAVTAPGWSKPLGLRIAIRW
jgi:hypothetical protein